MSYTDFYMQSGGNDLNSGSTNSNSAIYTSVSGNWDGVSVFTPTDGSTPANSVNVGDYVSIYNTGDTAIRYVAQVTAVAAGVNGAITCSTTIVYGTAPSSNSGSRNLKDGGAWASLAALTTNITTPTVPQSTRINIQTATYASATTTRSVGIKGTTTTPLWLRGYNTSIGDLDGKLGSTERIPGTNMPLFTCTTGNVIFSGAHQELSSLGFSTSGNSSGVFFSGSNQKIHRCRFQTTNASGTSALNMNGSNCRFTSCWISATATTTEALNINGASEFYSCSVEGGVSNINWVGGSSAIDDCILANGATNGILTSSPGILSINATTIYNAGTNSIKITAQVTEAQIFNTIFHTATNGINNNTGTNTNLWHIVNPVFYNVGTQTIGFGDNVIFDSITETTDPFINAAGLNFTVKPSALCYQNAEPGLFEEESNNYSYNTPGAVQPSGNINNKLISVQSSNNF